ncbi:hypothetical protein BDN72DRAFT_865130 [Pluteus cervinus]|uniref:Uncharacterized protein n=1 Tax=Pluteus cervinus TaxID=181527 RepID=A0ACD3A242_9AGAR|nr:hypothetical protein BDN72DRAFT_865130 [Pluteus cervinus]
MAAPSPADRRGASTLFAEGFCSTKRGMKSELISETSMRQHASEIIPIYSRKAIQRRFFKWDCSFFLKRVPFDDVATFSEPWVTPFSYINLPTLELPNEECQMLPHVAIDLSHDITIDQSGRDAVPAGFKAGFCPPLISSLSPHMSTHLPHMDPAQTELIHTTVCDVHHWQHCDVGQSLTMFLGNSGNIIQIACEKSLLLSHVKVAYAKGTTPKEDGSYYINVPLILGYPCNHKEARGQDPGEDAPSTWWNTELDEANLWESSHTATIGDDVTDEEAASHSTIISLISVADLSTLEKSLSSTLHQHKAWNIDGPVLGIATSPGSSIVYLVIASMTEHDNLVTIWKPYNITNPDSQHGVFDLADPKSVSFLVNYIFKLKPHFTSLVDQDQDNEPSDIQWKDIFQYNAEHNETDGDADAVGDSTIVNKWLYWRQALPCICVEAAYSDIQELPKKIEFYHKTSKTYKPMAPADKKLGLETSTSGPGESALEGSNENILPLAIVVSSIASMQKKEAINQVLYGFNRPNSQNSWVPWSVLLSTLLSNPSQKDALPVVIQMDCTIKLCHNDFVKSIQAQKQQEEDPNLSYFPFLWEYCGVQVPPEQLIPSGVHYLGAITGITSHWQTAAEAVSLEHKDVQEPLAMECKTILGVLVSDLAELDNPFSMKSLNSVMFTTQKLFKPEESDSNMVLSHKYHKQPKELVFLQ